jgi:hypothetical protein
MKMMTIANLVRAVHCCGISNGGKPQDFRERMKERQGARRGKCGAFA